jgi:hypothetical protein
LKEKKMENDDKNRDEEKKDDEGIDFLGAESNKPRDLDPKTHRKLSGIALDGANDGRKRKR